MIACLARSIPAIAVALCAAPALADPLFSQTFSTTDFGHASDLDFDADGNQIADNFTLSAPATVHAVTWRGHLAFNNTPTYPQSFTLYIYGHDSGFNAPDRNNVIGATTVTFAVNDVVDTGIDIAGYDLYEYTANINPVALQAGTTYWFSPLADTTNDTNDTWYWINEENSLDPASQRSNVTGVNNTFSSLFVGDHYFVLHGSPVPEPASLAMLAPIVAIALRPRRA